MFSYDNFYKEIKNVLKIGEVSDEGDYIKIKNQDIQIQVKKEEVNSIINELNTENYIFKENTLSKKDYLEESIKFPKRLLFRNNKFDKYDVSTNLYDIMISSASKQFIVATFCDIDSDSPEQRGGLLYPGMFLDAELDFWLWANRIGGITGTIQFKDEHEREDKNMRDYLSSYYFNISYNYNECILRIANISKRRRRMGVNNGGQLDPLRIYNSQLMDYYNQGVAADTAFSQYLAFYHVLEFFFQTVIEEDTLNYIKDTLTKPSFSTSSKRELTSFVKGIKKKLSNQKEKSSQGEQFALELCLEKHLNISDLTARLNLIDCECVDYYKGNKVSFAQDSIEVDFENEKTVISHLSQRIYSVRNAIVHSKDCDKLRYQPFNNDDELSKEIPLIKSIAEIVIINTAEIAK